MKEEIRDYNILWMLVGMKDCKFNFLWKIETYFRIKISYFLNKSKREKERR